MIIDNQEKFDSDKDELVWTKVICVYPLDTNNNKSVHIVKYYKTESEEEYYIFEYIIADNNGLMIHNFDGFHWNEIIKQIKFSNHCYIYSVGINDKSSFRFITSGKIIKKFIQEYKNTKQHTKIYELKHH